MIGGYMPICPKCFVHISYEDNHVCKNKQKINNKIISKVTNKTEKNTEVGKNIEVEKNTEVEKKRKRGRKPNSEIFYNTVI